MSFEKRCCFSTAFSNNFLVLSVAARREELFVCSGGGLMQRVTWDGQLENEPIPVHSILFTNDLETARGIHDYMYQTFAFAITLV